jgi:deoxyribonuclease V
VLLDANTLEEIEAKYTIADVTFPYLPGFLSYREAPSIVETYNRLKKAPDLMLFDGDGILHPQRIGLASHVGLLLDKPSIGVAKSLLCGTLEGDQAILDGEARGIQIISKEHAKPMFISPGHRLSLLTSHGLVKTMFRGHKLPEPLHAAHKFSAKIRRKIKEKANGEAIQQPAPQQVQTEPADCYTPSGDVHS